MIAYQPSIPKLIFFVLLIILFITLISIFASKFFIHPFFVYFLYVSLFFMVARALGTFLMYPGSYSFTRAEIEIRQSKSMMQGLQACLLDIQSMMDKVIIWDLKTLNKQKHCFRNNRLMEDLERYKRIIRRSSEDRSKRIQAKKNIKWKLSETFQNLILKIKEVNNDGDFSYSAMFVEVNQIEKLQNQKVFAQIQNSAQEIRDICKEIWELVTDLMYYPATTNYTKAEIGVWHLFGQRLFVLDSYFAYWDNVLEYTPFQTITKDKNSLQCVIIHGEKNSTNRPANAVLFCNPNGGFVQTVPLTNNCTQLYIKNNLQVILWNYRGYGKSTGSPSISKCIDDCEEIYHNAEKLFNVKIVVVHGYSIGGPCAIELAKKYGQEHIKLLVADRTFSRVDLIASGFLPKKKSIQNFINKVCSLIVQLFFYSECISNCKNFTKVRCLKICIWANFDEIIQKSSSLKIGLIHQIQNLNKNMIKEQQTSDSNQTLMKQQTDEYSQSDISFAFNRCISQKLSKSNKKQLISMGKLFSQAMANIYVHDQQLYMRFAGEFRNLEGGGIKLPCDKMSALKQFTQKHQQYYFGLVCFGPGRENSAQNLIAHLNHIVLNIRQQTSLIHEVEIVEELGKLVQTLQFGKKLFQQSFKLLKQRFGMLIVAESGHNGQLVRQLLEMQKVLKSCLRTK